VCGCDPGFVSTPDPDFGHVVYACPHFYVSVIVMSQRGDLLDVVEQGRGGESGVFSPFGVPIDGLVLKA